MSVEIKRYEFVLEARQPIAHHTENIGNEAILMRRKCRTKDGDWEQIPIISADTMRHGMREAAAYALLDAAGMLERESLSEAALRLLFAGGMVTGRGDAGVIKLDRYRELCELVPSIGLFGGCADNRCIPGRLIVDDALLICEETEHYIAPWMLPHAQPLDTHRAHVEEQQRVRMDPVLAPHNRRLLAADEQVKIAGQLASAEHAHEAGDPVEKERAKCTMMPRCYEAVARGSMFAWACEARVMDELDDDTFNVAVAAFLSRPMVGGKRGTGHGLLGVVAANDVKVNRPAESTRAVDTKALAPAVGHLFRAHVAERKERLVELLRSVNA